MKNYLFLFLFFISLNTFSQPTAWSSKGIGSGGATQNPAISPQASNTAYMTCDMSQVFKTSDDGQHWQIQDFKQLQGSLYGKVCFTNNANKLYSLGALSAGGYGLKHSTDAGATWSTVISIPALTNPTNLYTDITNSLMLVVATQSNINFSNNGGSTFSVIASDPSSAGIHLAGVFFDAPNIYVCTNKEIFVSLNNGASFNSLTTNTSAAINGTQQVVSFTGAKQGITTKFYCTSIISSSLTNRTSGADVKSYTGVYVMTLPTLTWAPLHANFQTATTDTEKGYYIRTLSNNYNTVYIGGSITTTAGIFGTVYKSTDGGTTWSNTFMDANTALTNSNITTGWIGYSSTAFYTHTWKTINTVEGICIDPNNINHLIKTDKSAIYKSLDGGNTWNQIYIDVNDANMANTSVPYNKKYLGIGAETFAAYWMTWLTPQDMITSCADISAITSNDGGTKWSYDYNSTNLRVTNNPTLILNDVSMVVKHPKTGILYGAAGDIVGSNGTWDDSRLSQSYGRLCKSTDNGATWQIVHNFARPVTYIEIDPIRPDTMFVCVHDVIGGTLGGIWKTNSITTGTLWTQLPQHPRANNRPNNIHIVNGDTLMASFYPLDIDISSSSTFTNQSGVFYSVDGGMNWSDRTGTGMDYGVVNITADRNDPTKKTWFACVRKAGSGVSGLYRTTNRGATGSWSLVVSGISAVSCSFHPFLPNEMYICTDLNGLQYATGTNSSTFVPISLNYPFRNPQRVFFNPYNVNEVWVTSFGYGLCVGTTSISLTNLQPNTLETKNVFKIYPIPTKENVVIENQGEAQMLKVTICDIIGKTVFEKTITSSEKTLSALLPELNGIYLLSIYTTEGTSTYKIIKE